MNRAHALLILFLIAAAAAAALLLEDPRPAAAARAEAAAPELPAKAADLRQLVAGRPEPRRLIRPSRPASAPATRRRTVRQGVRGVVTSPRVTLPDGASGVDPAAWECSVYALVPSPARRTVDRIGIARERAPLSARGDFEIDLPTGSHLVLVQHRIERPESPPLVEAWYAYADIAADAEALADLGSHTFAPATIRGRVAGAHGVARVELSDEAKAHGDPLTRGVHLVGSTDADGGFAFSLARADGQDIVARVTASEDGALARRDSVRPGDFVELVLRAPEPRAEVVLEIPWSPSTTVWLYALDRRIGFSRSLGRGSPGGTVEERRFLPPGAYVVEMFREAPERDEWARMDVTISDARPRRIRVDPAFGPARALTGRTRPGATVAWVTRLKDGSTLTRDSALAGEDGQFTLRCLPTTQTLLVTGSILTSVPPGCEPTLDVGELKPG